MDHTENAFDGGKREKCRFLIIGIYCLLNRSKHVYGKQFYFDITKKKSHVGDNEAKQF